MNKVLDFFTSNKYAIIWTVCYVFIMWAVLYGLFNFNIFVYQNWVRLFHAQLRGFPGFVFGILILAAIPMYIATTIIILRTKKPLFTVPLPKFLEPVPEEKTATADTESSEAPEEKDTSEEQPAQQKTIPTELRAAFIRARAHIGPAPKSNFDIGNMVTKRNNATEVSTNEFISQDGELPLPSDFDISPENEPPIFSEVPSFTPVFSDIDFDDDSSKQEEVANPSTTPNSEISEDLKPVIEYLTEKNKEFIIQGNLILTNQDIIAAHNSSDFWIADEKTWFASGKQKPSPIDALTNKSEATGLHPILYLGATNILDLETNKKHWKDSGIEVITELKDLK